MSASLAVHPPSGEFLLGGEWRDTSTRGRREHVDPATGKPNGSFLLAGAAEVDEAVAAARQALPDWRRQRPAARRQLLLDIADAIERQQAELRELRVLETGVPLSKSQGGALATEWFRYFAGWVDKAEGSTVPVGPDAIDYTVLEPYGVVAILIPWNAPLDSIGMKVAPALAAGNTVVLKPSELGPYTPLRFAELCQQVGLPPGVVNVLPGEGEAGAALVSHTGVDKISFTGGVRTARKVLASAAETLTPVVLELGGKSASLVFEDADLETATQTAVQAGLVALSGQACVLPTRLLVADAVYEEVAQRVVDLTRQIRVGHPLDGDTDMGPVIDATACERILGVVRRAQESGAGELLVGGGRLGRDLADGYFIEPTVFGDVDNTSELAREEVFGPVLSMSRFRDADEAVALANDSDFGLGGLIFTSDLRRAHRVAQQLEAGSLGINGFPPMSPGAPFGGVKASGYGREGGRPGLMEFLRPKNVHLTIA